MTEKDYQELNDYLNGCFIELEKNVTIDELINNVEEEFKERKNQVIK